MILLILNAIVINETKCITLLDYIRAKGKVIFISLIIIILVIM